MTGVLPACDRRGSVVLVRDEHVAGLRRLADKCIDDTSLRDRLVELADLATLHPVITPWTA